MKNGLIVENGELIYYKKDKPRHAGVIKVDGDIYYIGPKGRAIKGTYIVHREMTNGILRRGTYTFGEDYKLVKNSYVSPKKDRKKIKKDDEDMDHYKFNFKPYIPIALMTVLVVLLGIFVVRRTENPFASKTVGKESSNSETTAVKVLLPDGEKEAVLCSEIALKLYNGGISVPEAVSMGNPYRPYKFEYDLCGQEGLLEIDEQKSMAHAERHVLAAGSHSVMIDNLKIGTKYYYKVTAEDGEYEGSFITARSTRFLKIDNLKNVRDIGGYTTLDGKTVRQGMLIRGSEIDGMTMNDCFLKDEAVEYVRYRFGFAGDMDLRAGLNFGEKYGSRLGEDVRHLHFPLPDKTAVFNKENQPVLEQIFTELAKPKNYPMYLHSASGAEHTGTVCFLLEGVLNLPEEVMKLDYQMSGFDFPAYADSNGFNPIYSSVQSAKGKTIQEKITNYLIESVGVSEKEIKSIRNILLQK